MDKEHKGGCELSRFFREVKRNRGLKYGKKDLHKSNSQDCAHYVQKMMSTTVWLRNKYGKWVKPLDYARKIIIKKSLHGAIYYQGWKKTIPRDTHNILTIHWFPFKQMLGHLPVSKCLFASLFLAIWPELMMLEFGVPWEEVKLYIFQPNFPDSWLPW